MDMDNDPLKGNPFQPLSGITEDINSQEESTGVQRRSVTLGKRRRATWSPSPPLLSNGDNAVSLCNTSLPPLILKGTHCVLGDLQPRLFHQELIKLFGPLNGKILRRGDYLLEPDTQETYNKILNTTQIGDIEVTVSHVRGAGTNKGVVRGINFKDTEQDLLEEWASRGVIDVKLYTPPSADHDYNQGLRKTKIAFLTFGSNTKPSKLTLGYQVYTVEDYRVRPIRCYNCQYFGHIAQVCRGKERCSECGGPHRYDKCSVSVVNRKCCNCGGAHSAHSSRCPKRKEASKVVKKVLTENISYKEAKKAIYSPPIYDNRRYAEVVRGQIPSSPSRTVDTSHYEDLIKQLVAEGIKEATASLTRELLDHRQISIDEAGVNLIVERFAAEIRESLKKIVGLIKAENRILYNWFIGDATQEEVATCVKTTASLIGQVEI